MERQQEYIHVLSIICAILLWIFFFPFMVIFLLLGVWILIAEILVKGMILLTFVVVAAFLSFIGSIVEFLFGRDQMNYLRNF